MLTDVSFSVSLPESGVLIRFAVVQEIKDGCRANGRRRGEFVGTMDDIRSQNVP